MKQTLLIGLALLGALGTTRADIYSLGTVDNPGTSLGALQATNIADGNPVGMWNTMNLTGVTVGNPFILTVSLNLAGGDNSGLYAYLSHNGVLVPLLNRIGVSAGNAFGSSGAGLNVTLADSAAGNIHAAGNGVLSGSYQADGENLSPLSAASAFNSNGGAITLSGSFGNLDPNGLWTLFIADVVSGGGAATLNGWGMGIAVVPEPRTWVMVGGGLLAFAGLSRFRRSKSD